MARTEGKDLCFIHEQLIQDSSLTIWLHVCVPVRVNAEHWPSWRHGLIPLKAGEERRGKARWGRGKEERGEEEKQERGKKRKDVLAKGIHIVPK